MITLGASDVAIAGAVVLVAGTIAAAAALGFRWARARRTPTVASPPPVSSDPRALFFERMRIARESSQSSGDIEP